ncbi:phosphotransferase family protein [Aquibacillus sp. 3ASR75-11]|uniref:Phosphotransferase family protein n=1 Tax=Terrihalobacillus insolitus TaxID=2950438 RepID=A0A9X4AQ09_9BACI|nr:phosphotransferase family protein [Terrihalobacillus insolitus]MDC3415088.1 phosphotransferase family protein [Terrihalobacillus insolitus]MDC3426085.1 phosphotransferase family protein [Terrihalobacillus insolitus]
MEHILGEDWTITPAGGSSGEAYFAKNERKRLFLKRNSSPFLAVLSAQGIVPKLVWTKRLENGDVITAQKWLDGRELTPEEMQHPRVADMLSKIHHSSELLDMLVKIGKKPVVPEDILRNIKGLLKRNFEGYSNIVIHKALTYLENVLPIITNQKQVVCHCDMNHNNWLLSSEGELYLIDWDNAMIADPAMDLGMILKWYIQEEEWEDWLARYGAKKEKQLLKRMYWYLIADAMKSLIWNLDNGKQKEAAKRFENLKRLLQKVPI